MEIETLLDDYRASEEAIDILAKSKVVLLVGIISAGKDTIQHRLLQLEGYKKIVTCTTRQPRVNNGMLEENAVDYHFLSVEQMIRNIADKEMIEVNRFGANYYGTHIDEFKKAKEENRIALGDIDINGIAAFRKLSSDSVTAIFIVPPDYATWKQRLSKRYTSQDTFNNEWQHRRELTIAELQHALEVPYYHFIINDDLERAVRVTDEIAKRGDAFNRHDDVARIAARDLLDQIISAE